MEPYVAQIMQVGFNFAPVGWAQCAGQTLAINQNAALFSLIGTTFGGNGTTSFQLPQVQSRVIIGMGQAPSLSNYVWGQQGGLEQVSISIPQMPSHTHIATFTPPSATLQAVTGATAATAVASPVANAKLSNTFDTAAGGGAPQIYLPTGGAPVNLGGVTLSGGSVVNAPQGSNLPTPIIQPYLALFTMIALQGVFPSRG